MNRRSFAKASVGATCLLAVDGCNRESGRSRVHNSDEVAAAMRRPEAALSNIAGDVDALFKKQPTVYVPDFPADLTELRDAYDDLRSATGYPGKTNYAP